MLEYIIKFLNVQLFGLYIKYIYDQEKIFLSVNSENFLNKFIDEEITPDNSIMARIVRYLWRPKKCYVEKYVDIDQVLQNFKYHQSLINYFTSKIIGIILHYYILILRFLNLRWKTEKQKIEDINLWTNNLISSLKPKSIPKEGLYTFEGISWFVTSAIDVLDLIEKDGEYFIIDLKFMNQYEYKNGFFPIGSKGTFILTSQCLQLIKVEYENISYTPSNPNSIKALKALYSSILTYVTICTHACNVHFYTSYRYAENTLKYLDLKHPITRVLLSSFYQTRVAFGRATNIILDQKSIFYRVFSYTDMGIETMIDDYLSKHKGFVFELNIDKHFFTRLTFDEKKCAPFSSYITWYNYIRKFAEQFIYSLSKEQKQGLQPWIDSFEFTTIYELNETLIRMITYAFFSQVRHKLMSNTYILYTFGMFPSIIRSYTGTLDYTISEYMDLFILTLGTAIKEIPFDTNMSNLILDDNQRRIVSEFYENMKLLEIDSLTPLLTPNQIQGASAI